MSSRRTFWQRSGIEVFLVLVVVILIAAASQKFYARADLTEDKVYSLTPSSVHLLKGIEGQVRADLFLSRDVPDRMQVVSQEVKDLLSEYEARSAGHFHVRVIDPTGNPDATKRANDMGIPEVPVQALSRDQLQVKKVYVGLALLYEDKKETIPVININDTSNLEYEITSRIVKLTQKELPKIGVVDLSRNYQFDPQQEQRGSRFTQLKNALSKRFKLVNISLERDLEIPEDVPTVLLLNPLGLSDEAKYVIDQFVMRGGNLIAPIDAVMIGQGMQAFPALPGIESVLEKYGLKLNKQMVLDVSNSMATFSGGSFMLSLPYPMWVKIRPENFNQEFPPVSQLETLTLPWSGYFTVKDELPDGVTATPLLKTTKEASLMKSPFDLNPQQDFRSLRLGAEKGQYTLAYLLQGRLKSAFADEGVPEIPEDASEERLPALKKALDPAKFLKESSKDARIVAVADGRFIEDNFLGNFPDNAVFIENIADWLAQNEALIGIRSRGVTSRPVKELTEPVKNAIRYGNLIGLPLLIILFGVFQWMLRLRRRAAYKQYY
ncbi:MAG: hypothetical protein B1H03_02455 [Planctomycetales bacterium 4484_113]|nr:MAG: hypothetical protein B1H03_02455 [Planctomycetales bacterium 4484_113]